jgi:enoyl-CoA hydratase/3-hydroxyacyl-CoA dehydrogenase
MALGGGLELALCADAILALPKAQMAFPETGIGIYPGLGGTQRSTLRIGKGLAKYLILTGRMLSAKEAAEIGLIDEVISADDMFALLAGDKDIPHVRSKNLSNEWKAISDLYSKNDFTSLINGNYTNGNIEKEDVARMGKTMSYKAPIAMRIAEELIVQGKGPDSELGRLKEVFSSRDALKGLTNIGKRVEYEGK